MTESNYVGIEFAVLSFVQLVVSQVFVNRADGLSKTYFRDALTSEKAINELGIPNNQDQRTRLIDEVYKISGRAVNALGLLGSLGSAVAGLVATAFIAKANHRASEMWWAFGSAAVFAVLALVLIHRLKKNKLTNFVVGSWRQHWKDSKNDHPKLLPRLWHNAGVSVSRVRKQMFSYSTLTPYSTGVLVACGIGCALSVLVR